MIEFKEEYNKLINKTYGELNDRQKQTVYSMEIYHDSQDALIACDIYASTDLNPEFIDNQLRNTFGYNDITILSEKSV